MPLPLFWLLLLAALVLWLMKRKRTGLIIGLLSIVWLAMISLPFLPELLVKSLENRFHSLQEIPQLHRNDSVNILVLGSGSTYNNDLPPNDQLSLIAIGRLTEGIRLHRLLPANRMIFFGSVTGKGMTEGKLLLQTSMIMGVEESKISFLSYQKNTRMESLEYTTKYGTDKTLVLVTDAIHMPRAMFLFRLAGQSPVAAPSNHRVKSSRKEKISDYGPSSSNIEMMEHAMHEIVGIIYARLFYPKLETRNAKR